MQVSFLRMTTSEVTNMDEQLKDSLQRIDTRLGSLELSNKQIDSRMGDLESSQKHTKEASEELLAMFKNVKGFLAVMSWFQAGAVFIAKIGAAAAIIWGIFTLWVELAMKKGNM